MSTPTLITLATSLGLTLSTTFSIGSLGFSYAAIPAILLPASAPLLPPLELVTKAKDREYRVDKAPTQPFDSGVGDEKEGVLQAGASSESKVLSKDGDDGKGSGSPSTSSYLLRQWFHLFSKGMHTLPLHHRRGDMLCLLCGHVACFYLQHIRYDDVKANRVVAQESKVDENGARSADVDDERGETERLIREWGRMNAWRAVLPLGAVVCGVVGLVL
ncbi:hypothetical protein PMZ80_011066 [Knufia obscura]|uniref:Uncharacterized protein n=1 Tax=Knufia obscura TaxID=1635080 RepID=A0ABR0R8Y5_9EURO|nr:hypothetical protein PMZ80_011066 [Knufia obscura]